MTAQEYRATLATLRLRVAVTEAEALQATRAAYPAAKLADPRNAAASAAWDVALRADRQLATFMYRHAPH